MIQTGFMNMQCKCVVMLWMALFLNCNKSFAQSYDGLLAHCHPVDMTRVLDVYDWSTTHMDDDSYYGNLISMLGLDKQSRSDYSVLYSGKSFAINKPKYYRSNNTFIHYAQDTYNGFLFAWNVYCNYEVWIRINSANFSDMAYWVDDEDITRATKKIRASAIRNRELRSAARKSRDSIVEHLKKGYDEKTEYDGIDFIMSFCDIVNDKSFKFQDIIDSANHTIDNIWSVNVNHAQERLQRYLDAQEECRYKIMLDEMAACRDFDEQCVLWINWLMNRDFGDDYLFVLATGCALMDSGNYSPILDEVWDAWRTMFQPEFHGASVDALIPNAYYNKYRKKCFITCLKHIDNHPDDIYAMMCAVNLATNENLERFGGFGNMSMSKMLPLVPDRTDE